MSRLVRLFLLVTIAALLIQVALSLFSDRDGLVLKLVMLGVGIALFAFTSQLELKGSDRNPE